MCFKIKSNFHISLQNISNLDDESTMVMTDDYCPKRTIQNKSLFSSNFDNDRFDICILSICVVFLFDDTSEKDEPIFLLEFQKSNRFLLILAKG